METQAQDPRKGGTSASSAPADRACPGRHLAQRGIPEPERSEDSKFGDEIHEALATGDASKLSVEQFDIYEGCQEITNKLLSAVFGADASKAKVFRKQRFWCKVRDVVPNPSADGEKVEVQYLHSGEPDAVYRLGDTLLIPDFKTLPGALPDSPENEQLRDYVVMAARHLVAKRAAVAIVQPLVTYTPQLCLYDEADIARAEKEMFERIKASNSEKSPRIPGELQCKYCRAKNGLS